MILQKHVGISRRGCVRKTESSKTENGTKKKLTHYSADLGPISSRVHSCAPCLHSRENKGKRDYEYAKHPNYCQFIKNGEACVTKKKKRKKK